MDNIREKLVELLKKADRYEFEEKRKRCDYSVQKRWELIAEHLIANGVTVKGVENDTVKPVTDCHGCEYCDDPHPARNCALPDGTEQMLVCYPDGTILGKPFIYRREINFCPMCGRKLTTPPKGE